MSTLKGSERQKMLINYIKEGIIPEGYYVKETKAGTLQFRRVKKNDTESLIKRYEDKINKLRASQKSESET